jgi:hypothetical protein
MPVAIEEQTELLDYLYGGVTEKFLSCLSQKLGGDEPLFWQIIRIGKGDYKVPKYISLSGISVDTLEASEKLMSNMLLHALNGKGIERDVKAAKIFLTRVLSLSESTAQGSEPRGASTQSGVRQPRRQPSERNSPTSNKGVIG